MNFQSKIFFKKKKERNVDKQHIQSMCSILQTRRINFLKLCGSLCTSSYFVHLVVALQTNYSVEELTIESNSKLKIFQN